MSLILNPNCKIIPASLNDVILLVDIASTTFYQSHGHSASKADIDAYIKEKYNSTVFEKELTDEKNIYHLLFYNDKPIGYSKIILNESHPNIESENVTKLERLYILADYHDLKLGHELFNFNVNLSKSAKQIGIWLFVWVDNERAINFYSKIGFKIIGKHDFRISDTHSNPNHQMLLLY